MLIDVLGINDTDELGESLCELNVKLSEAPLAVKYIEGLVRNERGGSSWATTYGATERITAMIRRKI